MRIAKATLTGEAFVARRRGKSLPLTYNLEAELTWRGNVSLGDNVLGTAVGRIRVPEVAYDHADPATWDVQTQCDYEYGPNLNSSAGRRIDCTSSESMSLCSECSTSPSV